MNDAEYILMKRKKRLWPAKVINLTAGHTLQGSRLQVLSRVCTSQTRQAHKGAATYCLVEILGLNEQANVHCKDVELLTEESIECIAEKLVGQSTKGHDNVEEIIYRRALREALNVLREATPSKERSPSKATRSKASTWKKTKERAAGHWPPSSRNDKPKWEGETGEASAAPPSVGTQNKRSCHSRGKAKGSSSTKPPGSKSRVRLRNGELNGRPQRASKAKTPETPKKDVTLKQPPRPGPSRRSPRFSSGHERNHLDEAGRERHSPSSPSKCFARTSTPARSSHNCAKLTPGRKPGGKQGLRRSLLVSPVKCPSAVAEEGLSEKEEFPPRKYSKDLDGERHPQDSRGAGQKQIPVVSSLSRERRCVSCHEGSSGHPDPVGPILDGIQEESLHLWADEAENFQLCDLEGKAGLRTPSEPMLRPVGELSLSSVIGDEEEAEDEEELPSILLHQEPRAMEVGMLVWCKYQRYPYWPAVVKNVKRKAKKASVQFIDKDMNDKSKGVFTSLKNLKHFDCEEKQTLIDKARESYQDKINWCINLIADYSIRVACRSFTGTLLEYYADDMSCPVRKESRHNLSQMTFPQIEEVDSEDPLPEATPPRKVLPDRTRAARDRANQKIVEFIVKAKGADEHLHAILKDEKQSQWRKKFVKAPPHVTPIETYLEDDDQQERVVEYLRKVYQKVITKPLPLIYGEKFILDVLFPEAIIFAISAVDQIDYEKAEQKYIRGPLLSQREKAIFEEEILEKKRKQRLQRPTRSPEETS